jgi:hypothetical protein
MVTGGQEVRVGESFTGGTEQPEHAVDADVGVAADLENAVGSEQLREPLDLAGVGEDW